MILIKLHVPFCRNVGIDEQDFEKLERDVIKAKQEKVRDSYVDILTVVAC